MMRSFKGIETAPRWGATCPAISPQAPLHRFFLPWKYCYNRALAWPHSPSLPSPSRSYHAVACPQRPCAASSRREALLFFEMRMSQQMTAILKKGPVLCS